LHVGLISSSACEVCPFDKTIAKIKGCSGKSAPRPVHEETYDNRHIIYWNCPTKFIPVSVSHWFKMYQYQKEFSGADMPGWGNQTAKWLRFYHYYKSELSKLIKEKERIDGS